LPPTPTPPPIINGDHHQLLQQMNHKQNTRASPEVSSVLIETDNLEDFDYNELRIINDEIINDHNHHHHQHHHELTTNGHYPGIQWNDNGEHRMESREKSK
jgi:hypothetical protein